MDLNEFYSYVLAFYGADIELYPELAFTVEEVAAATQEHITSGDVPFDADSVDREIVRDIVMANRRLACLEAA